MSDFEALFMSCWSIAILTAQGEDRHPVHPVCIKHAEHYIKVRVSLKNGDYLNIDVFNCDYSKMEAFMRTVI